MDSYQLPLVSFLRRPCLVSLGFSYVRRINSPSHFLMQIKKASRSRDAKGIDEPLPNYSVGAPPRLQLKSNRCSGNLFRPRHCYPWVQYLYHRDVTETGNNMGISREFFENPQEHVANRAGQRPGCGVVPRVASMVASIRILRPIESLRRCEGPSPSCPPTARYAAFGQQRRRVKGPSSSIGVARRHVLVDGSNTPARRTLTVQSCFTTGGSRASGYGRVQVSVEGSYTSTVARVPSEPKPPTIRARSSSRTVEAWPVRACFKLPAGDHAPSEGS